MKTFRAILTFCRSRNTANQDVCLYLRNCAILNPLSRCETILSTNSMNGCKIFCTLKFFKIFSIKINYLVQNLLIPTARKHVLKKILRFLCFHTGRCRSYRSYKYIPFTYYQSLSNSYNVYTS